jgi:hypothetical protein
MVKVHGLEQVLFVVNQWNTAVVCSSTENVILSEGRPASEKMRM